MAATSGCCARWRRSMAAAGGLALLIIAALQVCALHAMLPQTASALKLDQAGDLSQASRLMANSTTTTTSPVAFAARESERVVRDVLSELLHEIKRKLPRLELAPQTPLARLIYDDNYVRANLDDRYPYLKQANGTYLGIRDYFNFDQVFWPSGEYLSRVNIEQHLYEEMRALEMTASQASIDTWHYSDERELAVSGGHLADAPRCRAALVQLERELERAQEEPEALFEPGERNMELLRWIDAWGRPPPETYLGNSFWLGSYRGCLSLALELELELENSTTTTSTTTRFNYCWAKVVPRDWPHEDVMRPPMSIRVGVCLPDACDTREARRHAPAILRMMHFNFAPLHRQRFTRLLDLYCLPVRPEPRAGALGQLPLIGGASQRISQMPPQAHAFLWATLAWLALVGLCSLREWCCCTTAEVGAQASRTAAAASWTRLLSVQENYKALASDDAPPASSRVDLRALGLPRLVASLAVLLGHSFIQNYYSLHSPHLHITEGRKYGYHLFALTWKSVEIFFVLSGILTSYSVLCKFAPSRRVHTLLQPRVYLTLQLVRFLRTAPLMMVVWAFVRTTFLHLSEGPYWDYGTNARTFLGACQRISWWRWLIYPILADPQGRTGDPYQHECLSVSWYVVTDLKMFLVVPLYIYIIYTRPRARWPLLFASLTISTAWRYAHLHLQQLVHLRQIFTYGEMHAIHIFITFLDSAYYSPVDRFQALALGLTGGLYLYKYKTGRLRRWPWWMRGKLPMGAICLWLVYDALRRILDEVHYRQTGLVPSDAYIRTWLVARPRLDALLATILTLRLCTDWAPAVMRHSLVFYKLSKISYCVYVVHSLIILYAVSSHERARPDSMAVQIFMLAAYVALLSLLIAFPLYLLLESPLTLVINRIISLASGGGGGAKRRPPQSATNSQSASLLSAPLPPAVTADKKSK